MTHVLHVIPGIDPALGGTTTALFGMAMAQRAVGLTVSVAATFREGEDNTLGEQMRQQGIQVHRIGPTHQILMRHQDIVPTLARLIPQVDIVHIHALWEEIQHQAAKVSRALKKPYVFTPHGMLDPWSLSQSRLKKLVYMTLRLRRDLNGAAAIHYTADTERDLVASKRFHPVSIVEPNGIELAEFESLPAPQAFRQKFPQVGDRRIVLFLSRIHPKKGLDLLLPAWAKAKRDDAVLVLAGPDNDGYGQTVNAMIAELRLNDSVMQTGMLRGRDRIEAFSAAHVFVLPSYQENFGIVVVEALASGAPVIISDQVNIHREITAAGVGGVVPTRVQPLADMIGESLSNSDRWKSARSLARPFALQTYDWNSIAAHWVEHYQRICGSSRS